MKINLFYSYSHKDEDQREYLATHLAMLKQRGVIEDWVDRQILPGQSISQNIKKQMDKASIFVFLISPHFIESEECMKEWKYAEKLGSYTNVVRVPIILSNCAWKDAIGSNLLALPKDGLPVNKHENKDDAWSYIYEKIKETIDNFKCTFTPKKVFLNEFEKTDFISEEHIKLQDIFVFPSLATPKRTDPLDELEIKNVDELLERQQVLVHGDEFSGRTGLCKHIFLQLLEQKKPVIFVDLKTYGEHLVSEKLFKDLYEDQFEGDYDLWKKQTDKTIIFDNLSSRQRDIDHIKFAQGHFDRIVITTSTNEFQSYFRDEDRLSEFVTVRIKKLSYVSQYDLIEKFLSIVNSGKPSQQQISHATSHIDSTIVNSHIAPRYPFYVLAILQTYTGFMPSNLEITSYGHCYSFLIMANLIKSGIEKKDSAITTCLNFAEHLAFAIYKEGDDFEFNKFVTSYKNEYNIEDSIINRMKKPPFGIIGEDGKFKKVYTYYFFLGKFLASNKEGAKATIKEIAQKSYLHSNSLILSFLVHHTNDFSIIKDILSRTSLIFKEMEVAKLDESETEVFDDLIKKIPKNVLSQKDATTEVKSVLKSRDQTEEKLGPPADYESPRERINDIYRILKNNEILGNILKTQHGKLPKETLLEIVDTVIASGLRLANVMLLSQKQVNNLAFYLSKHYKNLSETRMKWFVRVFSFLWVVVNVDTVVSALLCPDLRNFVKSSIKEISQKNPYPSYDLVGYFFEMESLSNPDDFPKNLLDDLVNRKYKNKNAFLRKVISIGTQGYMNTNEMPEPLKQSIRSTLGIEQKTSLPWRKN